MSRRQLFRVDSTVFERFPDYVVACVAANDLNYAADLDHLDALIASSTLRARASYDGIDLKSAEPFAAWRDAFSTAGWSASRFPASVEALHKRVQRGADLPRINPVVDLANCAVLAYSVPVGAHDVASFGESELTVRPATHDDRFIAMIGDDDPPADGEIVYAVNSDIRTRRWVWRQGRNALVPENATEVFFPIDGFVDRTYDAVVGAQNFLAETLKSVFGADVAVGIVDADHREYLLPDEVES